MQNENINKDENIGVNEIKNSDGQEAVSEPSNSSHISNDTTNDTTIESIKASWDNIISYIDQKNSKLSSFLEETRPKEIKENNLILELDNGNQFIKKVLDTDKSIIIDAIDNICNTSLNILVEMVESKIETKEEEKSNEEEKDHPLLDDAINIFRNYIEKMYYFKHIRPIASK